MSALSAVGLALSTQLSASIGTDTVVAELPRRPIPAPTYAVVQTVTPSTHLRFPWAGWHVDGEYTPQANFRLAPEPDAVPLFLHRVGVEGARRAGRDTLSTELRLVIGEVDFTTSNEVFGFEQSALSADPQIFVATTDAGFGYARLLTRRLTLRLRLSALDQRPLQRSVAVAQLFRRTTTYALDGGFLYRLTARDEVGVTAGPRLNLFEGANYLENRVFFSWDHRVTPSVATSLGLGFGRQELIAVDYDAPPPPVPLTREPSYFAIASAGIARTRRTGGESFQVFTDARPDPVLQTVRPQASVLLSSTQRFARRFAFNAVAGGSTTANLSPLPTDPNETSVFARMELTWSLNRLSLRTGGAMFGRGPHLVRDFYIRERLLSGFVGLTWNFL